jgi:hypothetical protein
MRGAGMHLNSYSTNAVVPPIILYNIAQQSNLCWLGVDSLRLTVSVLINQDIQLKCLRLFQHIL